MLIINFISNRRVQQLRYQRIGENIIRLTVLVGLGILVYTVLGVLKLRQIQNTIEQTNLAQVAFKEQAEEVRQLRGKIQVLSPRVELVQKTNRKLDHWRYLLVQVARSTPNDVRLDGIDVTTGEDQAPKMQVIGRGDNPYAISKLLLALNAQPGFSDVTMGQVTMGTPHQATVNASLSIKTLPEETASSDAASTGPS